MEQWRAFPAGRILVHFKLHFRPSLVALWLPALLLAATAHGQDAGPTIDPRDFGLDLPAGILKRGAGDVVQTADDAGQPQVGKIHVRVGDGAVILLPDGQLVARKAGQFSPTDRPYEPLDKAAVQTRLAAEFPGFKVRAAAAAPYVYVHTASDEFVESTGNILESMLSSTKGLKAFADNQRIPVHGPEGPLVVVIFRTEDEFQKYRRMPEGVVAYYHVLSNRVFIYEQSRLAQVRPDLAVRQSISTIAHEGAHQILHNIGVQQRLSMWPMWIAEGLAEYLAPTSTGNRLTWKGAGQVNDLRMFELEQYLKSRSAEEANGQMVEQTVLAGRLSSTGYATAWSLTHYLAKMKRVEFAAYLRDVSQLGPLEGATQVTPPGIVRGNLDLFRKHFGEDLADCERRLVLHLKKLPYSDPFADLPHVAALVVLPDGRRSERRASTFPSPVLAQQWVRELVGKLPEEERRRAESSLRAFPTRAQAQAFVRNWLRE